MKRLFIIILLMMVVVVIPSTASNSTGEVAFGGTGGVPAQLTLTYSNGSQLSIQAISQGWWSPSATNTDANQNYMIGNIGGTEYADYFSFNLPQTTSGLTITGATLVLQAGELFTGGVITLELWDVSTPVSVLENRNGPSASIYNDLSSGVSYGMYNLSAVNPNTIEPFALNTSAVSSINAAAGSSFSIGGSYVDMNSGQKIFHQGGNGVPVRTGMYEVLPYVGPTIISTCTTITSSGIYYVEQDLTTSGGDCMTVSASDVTLDVHGYNLTGDGSGAGIHITAKTPEGHPVANVALEGAVPGCAHFCRAPNTTISGFATGITDESNGTRAENFTTASNGDGLLLSGATHTVYSYVGSYSNTGSGIHIAGGADNTINDFYVQYNSQYGIWIDSSNGNYLGLFNGEYNGNAGVYVGCNPSFVGLPSRCNPNHPSGYNYIYAGDLYENPFDVILDIGSHNNLIAEMYADDQSTDLNAGCGTNVWLDPMDYFYGTCKTVEIPVTACGTITSSGAYVLQNALSSAEGDCIVIQASDVFLAMRDFNITGAISGAGIHILKSDTKNRNINNVFFEGASLGCGADCAPSQVAIISGFDVGIQDDAIGPVIGDQFQTNNNGQGILLNEAHNANLSQFESYNNNESGVHLLGGGGNVIEAFGIHGNGSYGVWLQSTSSNAVGNFDAFSNITAGAYLGCNPSFAGVATVCPKGTAAGQDNVIFNAQVGTQTTTQPIAGVAVDLHEGHDHIIQVVGSGDNWDGYDQNNLCGTNAWLDNSFVIAQPGTCTVFP